MNTLKFFPVPALAVLLLAGCATTRTVTRPTDPVEALQYDIDSVLADSIFIPSRASIKIVSLDRNETLYERDSKLLLKPASNMKLLTSSAALKILGTDFTFRTSILIDSLDASGTVQGNLYLKGYGNPDLTGSDLDSLIAQLKVIGINKITGNIVADASYFDEQYWGEGWMWDDEPDSDEAAISALSVNKNCVRVMAIPGKRPGEPVHALVDPPTSFVSLLNTAKTVSDTALELLTITRLYKDRLNTLVVKGETIAGKDTVEELVTVWRPELYAATLLNEQLTAQNIEVGGQPVIGVVLPWSVELASHEWPMDSMIVHMNKVSDNLSAESTLKAISVQRGGIPGSAKHGLYQVNEIMNSFGIDTTSYYVVDGSGVSRYNLVTAEILIQLLTAMTREDHLFPLFYESLPIAGVDGTLKSRMKGTQAEGNLRAKTGSIRGASSLSGYVTTQDGERLVFSMLMQNFVLPIRTYRNAQDAIGAILAGFSRLSSLAGR